MPQLIDPTLPKLEVIISDGTWNAYGDPEHPWPAVLLQILQEQGGPSDSNPNGTYHFYITELSDDETEVKAHFIRIS